MTMHSCADWRRIRFDWNHARAFLLTAQEGSLSAAARVMGSTQSTIGRQVAALEQELRATLLQRVGPTLTLTECGREVLEHIGDMAAAAECISLAVDVRSQVLEGTIALAASEIYCAAILPPIVAKLRDQYPQIDVEIVSSNEKTDLRRREADIAIRNYESSQADLVARMLRNDEIYLYATSGYLAKIGHPDEISKFGDASFVGFPSNRRLIDDLARLGLGVAERNFGLQSNSLLVQWEMVKSGMGIGAMTSAVGDAEPGLVRILPDLKPLVYPRWIATHRELYTSRRIRTVFDFLVAELR